MKKYFFTYKKPEVCKGKKFYPSGIITEIYSVCSDTGKDMVSTYLNPFTHEIVNEWVGVDEVDLHEAVDPEDIEYWDTVDERFSEWEQSMG